VELFISEHRFYLIFSLEGNNKSNIQGCVLGYTQSDEITLVLCDYEHDKELLYTWSKMEVKE